VALQLIFQAGSWFAPNREIAHFTARMLNEGTKNKNTSQIAEDIDKYGAFLEISSGNDYCHIELYALTKHLPPLLALLGEILLQATFPEQELQKLKDIAIQNLQVSLEKTAVIASNNFRAILFGEKHPYGQEMTQQGIAQVQRNELLTFYQRAFLHQPFEVLTAGCLTDKELSLIKDWLSNINLSTQPSQAFQPPQMVLQPQKQKVYIEKENMVQTSVRVGKPLFLRTDPDYIKTKVMNEIFGGYFGSRLMGNIREDKGYTYGISSNMVFSKNVGYLLIGADVGKDVREATVTEIFKEIALLQAEKVSKEELEKVKNYMKGTFINSLNTPFAIAEKYRAIYLFGLPQDHYQKYIEAIDAVTVKQVAEMAAKYLAGDYIEVLVG
jgi:zinc protease